ncbi:hypothetical protein NO1_0512 [Candidatus Termititenax aidoneus]|uniref:Uncharacterized protein n=1 Tax=Termititenax aidoneus TaxID=2218524 RepID=A0A388T9Z4_TERA1|nr:hypothetical protein NO1_0512 [Candidatus Termititenax aidoneus]
MSKNLALVKSKRNISSHDNRKAIELSQKLGRPLTAKEYSSLKIQNAGVREPRNLIFKKNAYSLG